MTQLTNFIQRPKIDSTNLEPITTPATTKRAIIFDCDGTIVSNEEALILAWQQALKEYNLNLTYQELTICIGDTESGAKQHFEKTYNTLIPDSIIKKVNTLFANLKDVHIKPILPTIALAKHLAQNKEKYNIYLAVASGARKNEILHNLRIAGIEECFDAILSGQDDIQAYKSPQGTNKPQPCVYLEAARLLGIPSWNCIAFEDSKSGAEAALQAGMHVFVIPTNATKSQFNNTHYGHRITFLESAKNFDINRYLGSQKKMTLQKALEHWAIK